jgi:hypothetical protein
VSKTQVFDTFQKVLDFDLKVAINGSLNFKCPASFSKKPDATMSAIIRQTILLLTLACVSTVWAQTTTKKSHLQVQEERTQRCPEGQYGGPHEGARSFYQDPYVWFVSREFAQRFCMPDSYIDDSLKGALALAVRLKNEEFTLCGFVGGPGSWPSKQKLLIDVYIDNRKVKIPKAVPDVKYYSGRVENSGWVMGTGNARADRRRKGEITEVEGEIRPFSPPAKDPKDWMKFEYLAVRDGIADRDGDFVEAYYRADWVAGIDLITLDAYNFGYGGHADPKNPKSEPGNEVAYPQIALDRTNPIRGWAIGMGWGADIAKVGKRAHMNTQYAIPYPSSFLHTIELPMGDSAVDLFIRPQAR